MLPVWRPSSYFCSGIVRPRSVFGVLI